MPDQIQTAEDTKEAANRPEKQTAPERRKHPRYQFTAAAEIAELPSGSVTKSRTSDLSATGCFVDTPSPSPGGTAVRLRLTKENRTFEARAVVAYSKVGEGMGLQFTDFKPEHLDVLERWMSELRGELPAESYAWDKTEKVPAEKTLKQGPHFVLNELIIALLRKGVLTDAEGMAMLQNLLH